MKKVVIFIIVICIIFIVLANNISANDKKSWEYNWGKLWNSWDNTARNIYLLGYTDGLDYGGMIGSNNLTVTTLGFDPEVIIPVITDLYNDPSNTFISLQAMPIIAYAKLKGYSFVGELIESAKKGGTRIMLITLRRNMINK